MTETERYNGWANRETWAVALHINNDRGWQESVRETVRNAVEGIQQDPPAWLDPSELTDVYYANRAGDIIRENVEETLEPYHIDENGAPYELTESQWLALQGIGSLWRVDWRELGARFLEDLGEEDGVTEEVVCDRHGGQWGDDLTCEQCTDDNGEPLPTPPA
jgi:hypothetical protein